MKKTALNHEHLRLGAKMADFAGYHMPLSYSSGIEEHHAVRAKAGLFDVSHMGEFIVRGREALDLVQYVTTNDASKLQPGQAQYSCMLNEAGCIIDDLLVYRLFDDQCTEGESAYMLVVNAANIQPDFDWIKRHNTFDTRLIDISEQTGLLALQGPDAIRLLQPFTGLMLDEMRYYTHAKGSVAGCDNVLVSATGYTGAGGFEIYADEASIVTIWQTLLEAYGRDRLVPAGLAARDTLRLEMCYSLYGNDIDLTTTPLEAGLAWITRLDKDDFIGKTALVKQKQSGLVRRLISFEMNDRRIPRHGHGILSSAGDLIGEVTSGTHSPSLDVPIGMGYVLMSQSKPGNAIQIAVGKKTQAAQVVKGPFWKK